MSTSFIQNTDVLNLTTPMTELCTDFDSIINQSWHFDFLSSLQFGHLLFVTHSPRFAISRPRDSGISSLDGLYCTFLHVLLFLTTTGNSAKPSEYYGIPGIYRPSAAAIPRPREISEHCRARGPSNSHSSRLGGQYAISSQ